MLSLSGVTSTIPALWLANAECSQPKITNMAKQQFQQKA
jgi:hypothetical protein